MTQSFDEWMDENHGGLFDMPHQRECFDAGAQSRQAEVNEIQKRIDKALIQISNHYHSCIARKALKQMSASASEIAEIEVHESNMAVLENILKGGENE